MSKGEDALEYILREEFPSYTLLSQYPIKINRKTLFIDFYIPSLKIAFEYDGPQHSQFVSHYHKTNSGLEDSLIRDRQKEKYCLENGITLIRIAFDETLSRELIREKIQNTL